MMRETTMSATLYVLVVLQGANGLTFSPGYTTAAECLQQYKGPNVACFAYDAGLSTWTAFFKLPEGGFRTVGKITEAGRPGTALLRPRTPALAGVHRYGDVAV